MRSRSCAHALVLSQVSMLGLAVLAALSPCHAQAPEDSLSSDTLSVHHSLERVLDDGPADEQTSAQASEVLTQLALRPLPLNRASAPELSTIPGLSPAVARRIVHTRETDGPYQTVDDLHDIRGVDRDRLARIRPYVRVTTTSLDRSDPTSFPSLHTLTSEFELDVIQRVTRQLELRRGYRTDSTRTGFVGSPEHLTTRLRLGFNRRAQVALTLDKDPGEAFGWAPGKQTYGFDHVAGNLTLRDWGPVETIVLGDYTVQFGQGVALWQGMSFGKGRQPVSPLVRSGRGIVPFQSTSENRYFRGIAASVGLPPFLSASGFVSRRHRDATLDSSAVDPETHRLPAQTLSTGGYHRTPSQQRRRATFGKRTIGGAVELQAAAFRAGLAGYQSWFDRPLRPPARPDRRFDVRGRQNAMLSAFAHGSLGPYTLFGEMARTGTDVYGGLLGGALNHEGRVQVLTLARLFPRAFAGLYNGAVGESGSTQNEQGLYLGARLRISKRWRLSAYVDQYRFPWARYQTPRPSRGLDTRVVAHYTPRPWLSSYVQVRAEREEIGSESTGPNGRSLASLTTEYRSSARWHLEYTFSEQLTTRTRVQVSRYRAQPRPPAYGFFVSQGLRLDPSKHLQIDARLALFDTDGYESRIYAYEHDLLYSFSVPVLYGRGRRSYVLVEYEPFTDLTIEAKYGVTWYPHRMRIGSGLNTVDDNRSREVRLQLRWQYE